MPVPSYQDLITPSSTANGLLSESRDERILSILAILASGKAPDNTSVSLGLSGQVLGRADLTATFTPTTTPTAITGLAVPVNVPSGVDIEVECLLPWVAAGATATAFITYLYEDTTLLRSAVVSLAINASGEVLTKAVYTPATSGLHTYTIQVALSGASAGAIVEAGIPAFGAQVNPYLMVKVV